MSEPAGDETTLLRPSRWDVTLLLGAIRRELIDGLPPIALLAGAVLLSDDPLRWWIALAVLAVLATDIVVRYTSASNQSVAVTQRWVELRRGDRSRRRVDLTGRTWVVMTEADERRRAPRRLLVSDGSTGFHLSDPRWSSALDDLVAALGREPQVAPSSRAERLLPEVRTRWDRVGLDGLALLALGLVLAALVLRATQGG